MPKCSKCGSELKDGQKFCMKCGTPVSVSAQPNAKQQSAADVCPKCGAPLKPGQKFCMKCGTPVGPMPQKPEQPGEKGWFTDGVRAVANAVTGGALNRDIERQQQEAVRRQAREDQGLINDAQQAQRTAERAQLSAEEEAERARDRRNQEAIDGVDVVRGRAMWNIQPGQIARRITESEFNEIEGLKGVIIQEGCTAVVYVDGDLVGTLSAGAYTFPTKSPEEKKADREAAENKVRADEQRHRRESFMDRGLIGTIGIGLNTVRRFFFGNKKGESEQKQKARREKVEKILKSKTEPKLIRVYLVSDRVFTLTFGGKPSDNGIDYEPFTVPTKVLDVEIGVSLQMQITNINDLLRNYLADNASVTTNAVQQMVSPIVQNYVNQLLRNLDYQQEGLPESVLNNLRNRIQQAINEQLFGIQCIRVLQITDRSADFERFRAVERELYCAEKELSYLQRTGEFRNRLAAETNKQEIDKATNEEDLRYALQQINKDQLLHDDEMEQFVLMLNAQKRLRQVKSQEEEYEALIDIKKSRLVKDDEMAALEDALAQNKIQRDSLTEIMRIQHQQSVDDACLKAQWALDDQKQDHDWEREDLQRRRDWGIEDEQREREWMRNEQEYNRDWARTRQEDEYEWQKRIRENDLEWQQRQREHEMSRQDKFDDVEILDRKASIAQRNMQAMKEAELRELQEKNRVELNYANMTAEQIRAAQLSRLSSEGQIAMANSYSKDGENELLKQQVEAAAKDKAEMMDFAKEMAGMVKDTAVGISGAQQIQQQQRIDNLQEDNRRQQERMDHTQDVAMDNIAKVSTAAAGNLNAFNSGAPQASNAPKARHCPACGAEVPEGEAYCPECGNRM